MEPQQQQPSQRTFHLFAYLNEDIKMTILSFLADAPFESMPDNYPTSTLTHDLPQVSQKFRLLASSDVYWKEAMVRQTKREPFLWKSALHTLRNQGLKKQHPPQHHATAAQQENKEASPQELVEDVYKSTNHTSYKKLYQNVVTQYLRFKGPVFAMEGQVCLGEPYSLHFFEPRYRLLIAELMHDYPDAAKHGGHIANPPTFVHANRGPLAPTTPATLVQVVRCELFPDGRADVVLMPKAYTWIEKVWEKPNTCGLHYAQCLRMGQATTHSMNKLARQEALTFMMDQLLGNLRSLEAGSGDDSSGWSGGESGESDYSSSS